MNIELLPEYSPLAAKTRYFLVEGGRGSAKSFHVAIFVLMLTYEPGHVILYTRYTMISASISIIPEYLEKIELLDKEADFKITNREIINLRTGSKIIFNGIKTSSGNQTANLKSIQGVTTWILDEAEELDDENTFDTIDLSIRSTLHHNRVILVMNPSHREHWIYKRFYENQWPDTTKIHTTYKCNKANLSQSFLNSAETTKQNNPNRYRHIFLGEWVDVATGLLWNRKMIDRYRIKAAPDVFRRVIIAVDPAVTSNQSSDETGIIVIGDDGGKYFILEDLSGKYTPYQWSSIVVSAYDRWKADRIVAEVNNGGDLVEAAIKQHGGGRRYKGVRATKGKYRRAEPIYALYEEGRVYHVGSFPQLEAQLVTFNPDEMKSSPDRADALVWGLTEISGKQAKDVFFA